MNEIIKNHLQQAVEFEKFADNLKIDHSKNEQYINDLYHILEYVKMDAVQISKITKKLTQALRIRRQLNDDRSACMIISSTPRNTLVSINEIEDRLAQRREKYCRDAHLAFAKYFK